MKLHLESKRFILEKGFFYLTRNPRLVTQNVAMGEFSGSPLDVEVETPGEFSLDLAGVEATDLNSHQKVRIAFFSAGIFSLASRDLDRGTLRIDADQGAVVWVKVVDPEGRPIADCDLSFVLPGRTAIVNPAEHGDCLVCPPYECWLGIKAQKGTIVALPTQRGDTDHTVTLTAQTPWDERGSSG